MDCTEFQAIVAGERDDDLTAVESEGFEAHLDACGACREAVSRAEEDLERLGQLADPPLVAASAWARVDEAIRAEARRRPGREDPFAPLASAPVTPAAPARPVTLERKGVVTPLPATGGRPSLAFAAVAAAAAVIVGFMIFQRPADPPIGRVKPPEPGDVQVVQDVKTGAGYKKVEGITFVNLSGE